MRPSKRNIEAEFDKMLKRLRRDDVFVCMFAGHGTEIAGEQFFCPEEAQNDSAAVLQASSVSLKKIMDDLEHSEAKFKWMIVDACRNDPTRSATSGTRSLGNISTVPSGIVVLQSCASGQQSWEDGT